MKSNTSKSNKPMTNYNERLDEIVDAYRGYVADTDYIGEEGLKKKSQASHHLTS